MPIQLPVHIKTQICRNFTVLQNLIFTEINYTYHSNEMFWTMQAHKNDYTVTLKLATAEMLRVKIQVSFLGYV